MDKNKRYSSNDKLRVKEIRNLVDDPATQREFWRSVGQAIARRPAVRMPTTLDKNGEETINSIIENYSYAKLAKDVSIVTDDKNTEPTELELLLQCQMVRARFDTAAATFIRDTLGAKPVDESKVDATLSNPYEELSDEELALLAEHRAQEQAAADAAVPSVDDVCEQIEAAPRPARSALIDTLVSGEHAVAGEYKMLDPTTPAYVADTTEPVSVTYSVDEADKSDTPSHVGDAHAT